VSEKTHGLIKSILDAPPDPQVKALLLNTIYFKGKWYQPFAKLSNLNMTFYNKGSAPREMEFMTKLKKNFPHKVLQLDGEEVQVLEMPYEDDSISMYILLPRARDGLKKLLSSDDLKANLKSTINSISDMGDRPEMNLYIPKFKLETKYSLKEPLSRMGITDIFSSSKADLSGINGRKDLYVNQVKHEAVVRVDEEGTEAAAATFADFYPMSASYPYVPPIDFKADHPFLFLIKDKASGIVLFMGKVDEL